MMAFSLTIPDLLRQIHDTEVDADLYTRCQKADRLCRQGEYDASLKHSKATVEAATRSGVALNIGVAFVYLAAIRHVVPRKDVHDQAPRDAETAVKWLKRDHHHAFIAHLVCGQIYADDGNTRLASGHYRSAQTLAAKLITHWHRRNKADQEKYYQEAQSAISAVLRNLQPPLAIDVESSQPEDDQRAAEEPFRAAPAPAAKADESSPVFQLEYRNKSDQFTLNYYEISRVWINGQEYLVETVHPVDPENPGLRLLPDQKYRAILVNEEGQPTEGPSVSTTEPVQLRVWTETEEEITDQEEAKFVGAVEVRLRLASSQAVESEPDFELDEDLLECIDAFTAAARLRRKPDPGLVAMHRKFLTYLRRRFNLHIIPITPRTTRFNEQAGHYAVGQTKNTRLPDNVIVQVVRNGYTRAGKIVREAQVIVNRK